MRIALLGAGHIGSTIAAWLCRTSDYSVRLADREPRTLQAFAAHGAKTAVLDFRDTGAVLAFVRGADAIVNALPFDMAIPMAGVAREAGLHYFDLTEDVAACEAIRAMADGAHSAFMPQCGLAPGFISIAAHSLTARFDTLDELKLRVGALPQCPTNALKYNLTWSVDGLVNEYLHPCRAIRDGVLREVQALEDLEHFSIDGVEYEASNTSGGLGTLCESLEGRVRTLDYKTIRYPGHYTLMRFLVGELRLGGRPELLKDLLCDAIPTTLQDVVVICVAVSGMRSGRRVHEVLTRRLLADGEGSAIQRATAAGVCAALDLFREGRLPTRGFVAQHAMALDDFLANRFGQLYESKAS